MKTKRCLADSIARGTARPTETAWHLHRGVVHYFIVGPGPTAMHPCSASDYASRHPTISREEYAIAHRAIAILSNRHPGDETAGVPEIKAALVEAAASPAP